jgi:fructose-bisphosphate aldolase / 2-amino-3,7-dideoxy-D-threo-hept-6-ulosonate synthase
MASTGLSRRLRRLEGPTGRFLLAALDHGVPAGPLPGIESPAEFAEKLPSPPIGGIVANPGIVRFLGHVAERVGLVVHLSAGTTLARDPTSKVLSRMPGDAFALGADAVSLQIQFGGASEVRMLEDAGLAADEAGTLGLPLIVMAYATGGEDATRHAVRAAAELHAQLVQTHYTGSLETFRAVVRGCPVPVLVAGGPVAASPEEFLKLVRDAMTAGAAGVSVGRNLFQHPDPAAFARQIGEVVFSSGQAGIGG